MKKSELVLQLKDQIVAIRSKFKRACLWEISIADYSEVQRTCTSAGIDLTGFKVIEFLHSSSLFLVDQELTLNVQELSINNLVDVSANLGSPKILGPDQAKIKINKISNLLEYLSQANNLKSIQIKEEIQDMTMLTGLLLGYPVIYCNDNHDLGNCLSLEPLINYQVKMDSLSSPFYSFSLPKKFEKTYEKSIENWFNELNTGRECANPIFMSKYETTSPFILT